MPHRARRSWLVVAITCAVAGAACLFPSLGALDQDASVDATTDASLDARTDASEAGPESGCAQLGRVQSLHGVSDGGTSTTLAITLGPQAAGDYVVVGVNYESACGSVITVTDTRGNAYQRLMTAEGNANAGVLETWGSANVAAASGGGDVVTVSFATTCKARNVKVVEYGGVDPAASIDGTVSTHGTDAGVDASLTTSRSTMLFAHTADQGAATGPGAGWTQLFIDSWATLAEEQRATDAGTYVVTYKPGGAEQWVIQAIALRACQGP